MARLIGNNHMEIESRWERESRVEKMIVPKILIVLYKVDSVEGYLLSYNGRSWYITNSEYNSIVSLLDF